MRSVGLSDSRQRQNETAKAAKPSSRVSARKGTVGRPTAETREIVIVLGMHRSGTSLLANILHELGVDMVDGPTHHSIKNEAGFWERMDIVALHDEILSLIGAPVGNPRHALPFPDGWWRDAAVAPLRERLKATMADHLARTKGPWGFKDPRTCRLLPLWQEILKELNVSPRFIWAVRHPAEASLSMSDKNPVHRPLTPVESEINWLAYNYDILRFAGRDITQVIPYETWFDDAAATVTKLVSALRLPSNAATRDVTGLIRKDLRHHKATRSRASCHFGVSETFYRRILGLPSHAFPASDALADTLQDMFDAAAPFAMAAVDAKALREEVATLKSRVAGMEAQHDRATALSQRQQENIQMLQRKLEGNRTKLTREREAYGILKSQLDAMTKDHHTAQRDRKRNLK